MYYTFMSNAASFVFCGTTCLMQLVEVATSTLFANSKNVRVRQGVLDKCPPPEFIHKLVITNAYIINHYNTKL